MLRALVLGLVAVAVPACSDPAIEIDLTYADPRLGPHVASWTVSVVDAVSVGATLGDGAVATCDDVAFGRVAAAVLEGARRASVAAAGSARISGVPRLGDKLVIVEVKSANGRRVGAGCASLGAIESDTVVPVVVEIAPRVQELGRNLGATTPGVVTIIATAPWDDLVPIIGHDVEFELYGAAGRLGAVERQTDASGLAFTRCLQPPGSCPLDARGTPGPLQTIVRVRWADELVRVAAFNEWDRVEVVGGGAIRLASTARLPAQWLTGTVGADATWIAATVHSRASDDTEEVVVAAVVGGTGQLGQRLIPAPGVQAIALWNHAVWAVLADGWYQFTATALPTSPTVVDPRGRASELVVVTKCDVAATSAGILVRRGAGRYDPYQAPSLVAAPGSTMDKLADAIAGDRVVGQLCASGPSAAVERLVVVQSPAGMRAIRIDGDRVIDERKFPLPLVSALTDFELAGRRGLAGAVSLQAGPRALSFRFATYQLDDAEVDVAVASNLVDVPIAIAPTSLAVADLDGDALLDVLALVPTAAGPRVQVVMGQSVAGEPLAALSAPLLASRSATLTARLVLDDVDGGAATDGCLELLILTEDGLDVFRGKLPAAGGQLRCPQR